MYVNIRKNATDALFCVSSEPLKHIAATPVFVNMTLPRCRYSKGCSFECRNRDDLFDQVYVQHTLTGRRDLRGEE